MGEYNMGSRDDESATRSVVVKVLDSRTWDDGIDKGFPIGRDKDLDDTPSEAENGQLSAPTLETGSDGSRYTRLDPEEEMAVSVGGATDWDHWTRRSECPVRPTPRPVEGQPTPVPTLDPEREGMEQDDLGYKWTATGGTFQVTDEAGNTSWASEGRGTSSRWKSPQVPEGEVREFTLTCTIDDRPRAISEDDEGERDDPALVRSFTVKVGNLPEVVFSGLARSCAGGLDLGDDVHTFTLQVQATNNEQPYAGAFTFEFENNRGHAYADGRPVKKAKLWDEGAQAWRESIQKSTDALGQTSVRVLSSDIVSQDIALKAVWEDSQDRKIEVGDQNCDFGAAESYRRFENQYDPDEEEDTGWLFNQQWLDPGEETTAKVYMKFMIDLTLEDKPGNWKVVNGHSILVSIPEVTTAQGIENTGSPSDYATLGPNHQGVGVVATTTNDGAATVTVRAGSRIEDAQIIHFDGVDQTQWSD